jgi:hypothetical protein
MSDPLPSASVVPRRLRLGWYWLLPALTLLIVAVVLALTWSRSGVPISLRFKEGHGIKPGDAIRCRGIIIGEVRTVRLASDTSGVVVQAELRPDAREVAQAGSRFWIVRPQADLSSGIRGLDTVMGARYISVLPGMGEPQTEFDGEEAPPIPETIEPGGLKLVLDAPRLAGLSPGAPVTFRQVRIGSVLSVGLAGDASSVEVHVYIRPAYARLVRDRSAFWNTSGMKLSATVLGGVSLALESAESLLTGGVALATPPGASKPVASGARFPLADKAPEKWEEWRPPLILADARLPEKATPPRPIPATLRYQTPGRLYGFNSYTHRGLVVPIGRNLLGPADLLVVPANCKDGKGELSLAMLPTATRQVTPGEPGHTIAWLASAFEKAPGKAPGLRIPDGPEECLIAGPPDQENRAVSVGRLKKAEGRWDVDAELLRDAVPQEWHGAAVVAVKDGQLIGLLMVADRRKAFVVPLDKKTVRPPP